MDKSHPCFRFGLMADCQYTDYADETAQVIGTDHIYDNRYRLSPRKLREAVETFNQYDLDFVIHLGDYTDRNLEESRVLEDITDELQAPLWHVLGNHDVAGYRGRVGEVVKRRGMPSRYYSKQIAGYRLIILDTNDLGVLEYEEGTPEWQCGKQVLDALRDDGALQPYEWNGGLGDEQLRWLEEELSTSQAKQQKAILFAHHPVFPPGTLNALNDTQIISLIEHYPHIIAYINGHNHIGDYGEKAGVPYLTVEGMLQGESNAYGIGTVYPNQIEIQGFGRMESHILG